MAAERIGDIVYNLYDRNTGMPFNGTIFDELPAGVTVDDVEWFVNIPRLGGGYLQRNYDRAISVRSFGAKGKRGINDTFAFQNMFDTLGYIFFNDGEFEIGQIVNTKWTTLTAVYGSGALGVNTGMHFFGESPNSSIIVPTQQLIDDQLPLIVLDGNAFNQGTTSNPAAQVNNLLHDFSIDGGELATAMYNNACWRMKIDTVVIKNVKKPFDIVGASTPDAGTSSMIELNKVTCVNGVDGMDVSKSRAGTTNVTNSEFRNFTGNAVKGAFASAKFDSVNFVGCGNNSDTTSGGLRIMSGTVAASQNRALTVTNCIFENNKWGQIRLENVGGAKISGCTFHEFFNIPTLVGNEQCSIIVDGESTYGVTGLEIDGCRIQPAANPVSGAEIFRFLKASGKARNIKVTALSAPIDSHLQYLYSISNTVENFTTDSFGVKAGWRIPQGAVIAPFTGDNTAVYNYDAPLLSAIVRDFDYAGGIDAGANFVGSRFDSQFRYTIPWNGIYNITIGAGFSGLVNGTHNSVRIVLVCGGSNSYVVRQVDSGITPISRGNDSIQVRLNAGNLIYLQLQVTGSSKVVTLSEAVNYIPLMFTISQV